MIATAVGRAGGYLLAHQNSDGSFGSPATPYETALAYIALVGDGQTQGLPLQNAVDYLTSTQSANGSWNDDPYSTALAVKALHFSENKPSPPPPPPPGGRITGTVIDATTKAPVSGVAVAVAGNALIYTTSDPAGNFTLHDVPSGAQTVRFSLEGYASSSAATSVAVDALSNLGNISLLSSYSTGSIAGTIRDAAGKPLADVAITVNGAWSGSALTDAEGGFSFSYVTPGVVTIAAEKSGYRSVTGTGSVYARTTLTYSPIMSATPSEVTTGSIVGRVVDDYWGLPIDHLPEDQGVTVTVSGGVSVEPDPDNRGSFSVQGLLPNTYQVTVGMSGYTSKTFRVLVTPGATIDLGTIRLALSISEMNLTGKVTDAVSGAPISGAEVAIDGSMLAGRTDFAGSYAIAGIPHPSQFTLRIAAAGYTGKSYTVRSSAWTQNMNISLAPQLFTGSVTGTVVNAALGHPLEGVTLALVDDPSISSTSDSAGLFNFGPLPSGVRKIKLSLEGYMPRIVTTAITAGVVNDIGKLVLDAGPLPTSIRGKVRDAVADAPFAGVEIKASGSDSRETVTAADGSYELEDVTPGRVTVEATAATKPGYYPARLTGELEPGGVLVYNPVLSTMPAGSVDVALQSDKGNYQQGESGILTVYLRNVETAERQLSLRLRITDPAGAAIYEANTAVTLPSGGTAAWPHNFALPPTTRGICQASAQLYDQSGALVGAGSMSFGVAVSEISVIPVLPASFSAGPNALSFTLANTGTLAVSAGALAVTLKDPDGVELYNALQSFSLPLGESATLAYPITLPALKFGVYTLSYSQSDETKAGTAAEIPLPNSVTITPLFDSSSHRIRESANLTVTVRNTGRFNLDSAGSGLAVTLALPHSTYTETKLLAPAPAVGDAGGGALQYTFAIPESLGAGQHSMAS